MNFFKRRDGRVAAVPGGHEIPEPVLRKLGSFLVKTIR